MNRRSFLRAALVAAALPALELVPVPVPATRQTTVGNFAIWNRALSDAELATLSRGHGLLTVLDQLGAAAYSWVLPTQRIDVDWGVVTGTGTTRAVADPRVSLRGELEFTKVDPGIDVLAAVELVCPSQFTGRMYRKLAHPIHMVCADSLHLDFNNAKMIHV